MVLGLSKTSLAIEKTIRERLQKRILRSRQPDLPHALHRRQVVDDTTFSKAHLWTPKADGERALIVIYPELQVVYVANRRLEVFNVLPYAGSLATIELSGKLWRSCMLVLDAEAINGCLLVFDCLSRDGNRLVAPLEVRLDEAHTIVDGWGERVSQRPGTSVKLFYKPYWEATDGALRAFLRDGNARRFTIADGSKESTEFTADGLICIRKSGTGTVWKYKDQPTIDVLATMWGSQELYYLDERSEPVPLLGTGVHWPTVRTHIGARRPLVVGVAAGDPNEWQVLRVRIDKETCNSAIVIRDTLETISERLSPMELCTILEKI